MDGSITRRGQPCWYKVEEVKFDTSQVTHFVALHMKAHYMPMTSNAQVGLIACNDYILLECCIYRIIKKHFASHKAYVAINDLFHDVTYQVWERRTRREDVRALWETAIWAEKLIFLTLIAGHCPEDLSGAAAGPHHCTYWPC